MPRNTEKIGKYKYINRVNQWIWPGRGKYQGTEGNGAEEAAEQEGKGYRAHQPRAGALLKDCEKIDSWPSYITGGWQQGKDWEGLKIQIKVRYQHATQQEPFNDEYQENPEPGGWYSYEGIQSLRKWSEAYSNPGKERDLADAYCFQVYHSTHSTAAGFLSEIACHYPGIAEKLLLEAAQYMNEEAIVFKSCAPHLWWDSPWGVDEERSRMVAPILSKTADLYEKAIENIEEAIKNIE